MSMLILTRRVVKARDRDDIVNLSREVDAKIGYQKMSTRKMRGNSKISNRCLVCC